MSGGYLVRQRTWFTRSWLHTISILVDLLYPLADFEVTMLRWQVYRGKWNYTDVAAKEYFNVVAMNDKAANQQQIEMGNKMALVGRAVLNNALCSSMAGP